MNKKFFTLVEMMAVIFIIGVLMGLISMLLPQVRERGRRIKCANNLKNIGGAIFLYADDHYGKFPFDEDEPSSMISLDSKNGGKTYTGSEIISFKNRLKKYIQNEDVFQCPSVGEGDRRYISSYDGNKDGYITDTGGHGERMLEYYVSPDHYVCLNTPIRPGTMTSGLPLCADLYDNHEKPSPYGNVLFGDGRVIGFLGNSKTYNSLEERFNDASEYDKKYFGNWQKYQQILEECNIPVSSVLSASQSWVDFAFTNVYFEQKQKLDTGTKVDFKNIKMIKDFPWSIPNLGK